MLASLLLATCLTDAASPTVSWHEPALPLSEAVERLNHRTEEHLSIADELENMNVTIAVEDLPFEVFLEQLAWAANAKWEVKGMQKILTKDPKAWFAEQSYIQKRIETVQTAYPIFEHLSGQELVDKVREFNQHGFEHLLGINDLAYVFLKNVKSEDLLLSEEESKEFSVRPKPGQYPIPQSALEPLKAEVEYINQIIEIAEEHGKTLNSEYEEPINLEHLVLRHGYGWITANYRGRMLGAINLYFIADHFHELDLPPIERPLYQSPEANVVHKMLLSSREIEDTDKNLKGDEIRLARGLLKGEQGYDPFTLPFGEYLIQSAEDNDRQLIAAYTQNWGINSIRVLEGYQRRSSFYVLSEAQTHRLWRFRTFHRPGIRQDFKNLADFEEPLTLDQFAKLHQLGGDELLRLCSNVAHAFTGVPTYDVYSSIKLLPIYQALSPGLREQAKDRYTELKGDSIPSDTWQVLSDLAESKHLNFFDCKPNTWHSSDHGDSNLPVREGEVPRPWQPLTQEPPSDAVMRVAVRARDTFIFGERSYNVSGFVTQILRADPEELKGMTFRIKRNEHLYVQLQLGDEWVAEAVEHFPVPYPDYPEFTIQSMPQSLRNELRERIEGQSR
jgi:hypothetical protein